MGGCPGGEVADDDAAAVDDDAAVADGDAAAAAGAPSGTNFDLPRRPPPRQQLLPAPLWAAHDVVDHV